MKPIFSIITVNYNNKDGLRKTIQSVINQDFKNFEYIIIDGGSTDGSVEVIKEYADKIDYWVSEPDKGIYNAMNKGILQVHGEYLNFMNSGDLFYNNNVLTKFSTLCNKDIILGKQKFSNGRTEEPPCENFTMMTLFKEHINHQSTFISHKLFTKQKYDENYRIMSDWKFFVDHLIFKNCTFQIIPEYIALYDITGISAQMSETRYHEKGNILQSYLPPRIYKDYINFIKIDSPITYLMPEIFPYPSLERAIIKLIKGIIKIHKIYLKIIAS